MELVKGKYYVFTGYKNEVEVEEGSLHIGELVTFLHFEDDDHLDRYLNLKKERFLLKGSEIKPLEERYYNMIFKRGDEVTFGNCKTPHVITRVNYLTGEATLETAEGYQNQVGIERLRRVESDNVTESKVYQEEVLKQEEIDEIVENHTLSNKKVITYGAVERAYDRFKERKEDKVETDISLHSEKYDRVAAHKQVLDQMHEIFKIKNHDYSNSFGEQYEEYGILSGLIRLDDKMRRLKQLSKHEAKVKDESLLDTVMDLSNYGVMLYMELLKEAEGK